MTPKELRLFLQLLDVPTGTLAKSLGRSVDEICQVLSGARPNPKIRKGIVEVARDAIKEDTLFGDDHRIVSQHRYPPKRRARAPAEAVGD